MLTLLKRIHLSRQIAKRTAVITFIVFGLLVGLFLYFALNSSPPQSTPTALSANIPPAHKQKVVKKPKQYGLPMRLMIPKLNVDSPLERVGLTSKGDVGAPKVPANAGWFNQGPRPGAKGNAVIVGHYGWEDDISAVFDSLHKLKKGDSLSITDSQGTTISFIVRELRTYGKDDIVPSVFVSNDNKAHLNLITCGGDWNKSQKSYSSRLVVFTDQKIE